MRLFLHTSYNPGLEEGEYRENCLCITVNVYYYNGAQRYEKFLQVGQLHRALILLGFWFSSLIFRAPLFWLISLSLPFSQLSLVGLALDLVDLPSSFSAMTLLVWSCDP